MLRELSVQNLALIEDARVELDAGYSAWTGETGAGKSLLLTALGLVLGGKATAELVRAGKPEARASAVFDLDDPELRSDIEAILGGPIDDDSLILTRRISSSGRGQSHANGEPVSVSTLRKLGERLIDVHGQHEGRALLDPDRQRDLLDAFGGLGPKLERYRSIRVEFEALRRRRIALLDAARDRDRERALLAFERDELAAAEPIIGEYDQLLRDAHRLADLGEIRSATADGFRALYEADRSVQETLCRLARRLEPLGRSLPGLADAASTLERLADEVRDVAYGLRSVGEAPEEDAGRIDEIEERLAVYRRLSTRFRRAPDELPGYRDEVESRLAAIEQDASDLAGLDLPLAEIHARLKNAASELSTARRKVAKGFVRSVSAHLKDLSLPDAKLTVEIDSGSLDDGLGPTPEAGVDRVEIVFAPNPGEASRPLRKIASGGELSRVTLAIKTVLAEVDRVPTLVFDEIDTGVGGRLGGVLGRKLSDLSRHRQVLCITHLPQMASFARRQWAIRKRVDRGRTRTTITPLGGEARVDELAAMLRGDSAAEGTRREAFAMLSEAQAGQ